MEHNNMTPWRKRGDDLVVCNLQATSQDSGADLVCACDISKTFDF